MLKIFSLLIISIAISSMCHSQVQNILILCKFEKIHNQMGHLLPNGLQNAIDCCGVSSCGGMSFYFGEGTTVLNTSTISPEWFSDRTILCDTVYYIKKVQSWIFETNEPVSGTVYELPANFTEGVEVAVSVTPVTSFERFRLKLQSSNQNQIIMMDIRRDYGNRFNKVIIKCKFDNIWNVTSKIWETSVSSILEPFPFASDVLVTISFKNVNDTIQIKVNGISYMFFKSFVPLAWADEVRIQDDAYLNRIDFYDTFVDSVG